MLTQIFNVLWKDLGFEVATNKKCGFIAVVVKVTMYLLYLSPGRACPHPSLRRVKQQRLSAVVVCSGDCDEIALNEPSIHDIECHSLNWVRQGPISYCITHQVSV